MSWQWVSVSLSRSAIQPEPFSLHASNVVLLYIKVPSKQVVTFLTEKTWFLLMREKFLIRMSSQLFLLFSFGKSMKFSAFEEYSWHESSTTPARQASLGMPLPCWAEIVSKKSLSPDHWEAQRGDGEGGRCSRCCGADTNLPLELWQPLRVAVKSWI